MLHDLASLLLLRCPMTWGFKYFEAGTNFPRWELLEFLLFPWCSEVSRQAWVGSFSFPYRNFILLFLWKSPPLHDLFLELLFARYQPPGLCFYTSGSFSPIIHFFFFLLCCLEGFFIFYISTHLLILKFSAILFFILKELFLALIAPSFANNMLSLFHGCKSNLLILRISILIEFFFLFPALAISSEFILFLLIILDSHSPIRDFLESLVIFCCLFIFKSGHWRIIRNSICTWGGAAGGHLLDGEFLWGSRF